ncbi:MAG: hypothetical protein E6Q97_17295 [Desulfurellales bacterium]|nr:MAG: hypothetical protein E6Q97_17295 [Desulfurellales bacterium]
MHTTAPLRRGCFGAVAAILIACGVASGMGTLLVTRSGYFWLTEDATGIPVVTRVTKVIDLSAPSPAPVPPAPVPPAPVPPTPIPPTPVVPADEFGNVGQESFRVASALSPTARAKAKLTGAIYERAADGLENAVIISIQTAANQVAAEREVLWDADSEEWKAFVKVVQTSMNAHWPMDKLTFAKFYRSIAAGLKAVQ